MPEAFTFHSVAGSCETAARWRAALGLLGAKGPALNTFAFSGAIGVPSAVVLSGRGENRDLRFQAWWGAITHFHMLTSRDKAPNLAISTHQSWLIGELVSQSGMQECWTMASCSQPSRKHGPAAGETMLYVHSLVHLWLFVQTCLNALCRFCTCYARKRSCPGGCDL